jgi:hypothetical protein
MTITHLIQLHHNNPTTFDSSPEEVGLGSSLTVLDRREDQLVLTVCTFGLDSGRPGASFDGLVDADHLSSAQRAVWETQRCVIPMIGFRRLDRRKAVGRRWMAPSGLIAFVPALRYSIPDEAGRHAECQLLVRETPPVGELPFALTDVTPRQWLTLDGDDAWAALRQDWRRR